MGAGEGPCTKEREQQLRVGRAGSEGSQGVLALTRCGSRCSRSQAAHTHSGQVFVAGQ